MPVIRDAAADKRGLAQRRRQIGLRAEAARLIGCIGLPDTKRFKETMDLEEGQVGGNTLWTMR